ncbi:lysoplasmalogenase [candidate division KSB1 bacterium]|nr:lysoplasmalogenase [candidate division KSB1 bacterium]RQW06091.1 MAG: lysoplasmalogenase [candidate division KSB1 bacterium]
MLKPAVLFFPVLCVTVFLLIRAEIRQNRRQVYFVKPVSTLLVIAAAAIAFLLPSPQPKYTTFILAGLLFSLGGDIVLMFQSASKAFRLGLVLFLIAHVAYTIIFSLYGALSLWDVLTAAILLIIGVSFYQLIKKNLGAMKIPVILYIVIISVMVNRAFAALVSPVFNLMQAVMIAAGALLFYLSDFILAANRFWKPWPYHRISLGFYYAGQFLLALSANYF